MWSAISLNLDQSKILLSGNELNLSPCVSCLSIVILAVSTELSRESPVYASGLVESWSQYFRNMSKLSLISGH